MKEIKKLKSQAAQPGAPSEEDLALISEYSRAPLTAEDVYTFSVILCDNELDRDFQRFSIPALNKMKEMFTGITGISDHNPKTENQNSRIFKTEIITNPAKKTEFGEDYTCLKGWCYMLRSEKNTDLINEINAGIKKEASVSFAAEEIVCSLCGKNMAKGECFHRPGETVDGKLCYGLITEPADAYEWSFVAVPAQKNAGVTKSFGKGEKLGEQLIFADIKKAGDIEKAFDGCEKGLALSKEQTKIIGEYIKSMKKEAQRGQEQRLREERETVALAAFTLPYADTVQLAGILKKISGEEVSMLRKAFEKRGEALGVTKPSLISKSAITDDSQFKI